MLPHVIYSTLPCRRLTSIPVDLGVHAQDLLDSLALLQLALEPAIVFGTLENI